MNGQIFGCICVAFMAILVGCATTSAPTPTGEPTQTISRPSQRVQVFDITSVQAIETTINNQNYLVIQIRTSDGKIYHGQQKSSAFTDGQRTKLNTLKSVELVGIIALPDRHDEYSFRELQNLVYHP